MRPACNTEQTDKSPVQNLESEKLIGKNYYLCVLGKLTLTSLRFYSFLHKNETIVKFCLTRLLRLLEITHVKRLCTFQNTTKCLVTIGIQASGLLVQGSCPFILIIKSPSPDFFRLRSIKVNIS